jgi:hypothetical protein
VALVASGGGIGGRGGHRRVGPVDLTDQPLQLVQHLSGLGQLWTTDLAVGLHDWPVPGWEGWELEFWGEDHREHAALAAECVRFPDVDLAPILTGWLQRIGEPAPFPTAALALAMTPPPGTDLVPVVHPEATVRHMSPKPTAEETRALHAVIAELLTRATPGSLPR